MRDSATIAGCCNNTTKPICCQEIGKGILKSGRDLGIRRSKRGDKETGRQGDEWRFIKAAKMVKAAKFMIWRVMAALIGGDVKLMRLA
jgi:hypothetical protein